MNTCTISRWRPFQSIVDLPELRCEGLPLLEVSLRELHQIIQPLALVVAAYSLVQRPPHQLHRVALRRPRGQGMQIDAPFRVLHVLLNPLAHVAAVVVHREVQFLVAAVGSSHLVEQPDEQLAVPALRGHPVQAPRLEVQRPRDPHLAVGSRSAQVPLFTFSHPAEAHLGVGLQLGLVLEKRSRFLGHLQDIPEPRPLLFDLLVGAFLGRYRTRPPPVEAETKERAADGLPANRGGPLPEKLEGEQLAAPARAQPAMPGGRVLFEQALDALLIGRTFQQRFRASPYAVVEGPSPLPDEASDDRVDGGARAEEDPSDLGGRATIGDEQHDVHPQPPAGSLFALHLDDEVLAFLRGDGDTLHGRPSLWWLDGFGVFTMPQEMAVCSIILCSYLACSCLASRLAPAPRSGNRGRPASRPPAVSAPGCCRPWRAVGTPGLRGAG